MNDHSCLGLQIAMAVSLAVQMTKEVAANHMRSFDYIYHYFILTYLMRKTLAVALELGHKVPHHWLRTIKWNVTHFWCHWKQCIGIRCQKWVMLLHLGGCNITKMRCSMSDHILQDWLILTAWSGLFWDAALPLCNARPASRNFLIEAIMRVISHDLILHRILHSQQLILAVHLSRMPNWFWRRSKAFCQKWCSLVVRWHWHTDMNVNIQLWMAIRSGPNQCQILT